MRDRGPFERFSALLRRLICSFIWTFTIVMLYFQGSGRLTHDEMRRFRDEGLNALAAVIGARYAEQKTRESIEAANTRREHLPLCPHRQRSGKV